MISEEAQICIIDDDVAVCNSLKFLLESYYDLSVKIYHHPELFLNDFSCTNHGCLIIDLFMPLYNGIDLMKKLKKRHCQMGVIIMSGHASIDIEAQCIEAGAAFFINKPFNVDKLLKKVKSIMQPDL